MNSKPVFALLSLNDVDVLLAKLKESPVIILLGLAIFLLSALLTATNSVSRLYDVYSSSLGYKRSLRDKLSRLSVGVSIDYFRKFLDAPAFIRTIGDKSEYVFVNKYFYVQAIADEAGQILAFSVTTRSYRFNPALRLRTLCHSFETSARSARENNIQCS